VISEAPRELELALLFLIFVLNYLWLESDPETPCCHLRREYALPDVRQNKLVHDAPAGLQQFLSKRTEELLLVDYLPYDVEAGAPGKFCEDR